MIIFYKGARGKGKTLTMVKDGLRYKREGWRVLTNLEGTPFETVTSEEIISLSGQSKLFNVVLLIDEIELFFDSREWNKKEAKEFGRFLQQIRKRNVPILCTAQFSDLIEKRLRQQIDIVAQCTFNKKKHISRILYIDLTGLESNELRFVTSTYYAKPLYGLYNTKQIITL